MNKIDVTQRGIGATVKKNTTANLRIWAPHAKEVMLCSYKENNRTDTKLLKQDNKGYWYIELQAAPGTQYKFILDGKEIPDPASLYQPDGVHGVSEMFDTNAYEWTDRKWVNPALEQYIFYELHTGTFTAEGTFKAIEDKLDHLLDLGITAIEIMPVAQFPGGRNWGYDGVFPFAAQNTYGGPQALQHLVNKCHEKGLAVVLDVVYNHMGPEGNYLSACGPYFTDKYKTPWGDAINFDDAYCDEVRKFFIENALMWLRDFHIDALRLDAVHAIKDLSPMHILREIKENVDELMQFTGRKHYLIAECDLNDPRFINRIEDDGFGMDAQWTDEFHHALRVATGNKKEGYYADFNGLQHLAKAYKDAYVYNGIYSPHRVKTFGAETTNEGKQFVIFSQNHDQVGNRMLGERTSMLVSFEMQKLMVGAIMVSPYLPLIFMGEEWGEPHPFQYFISHTDKKLVEAVCKGRKAEFATFHNEGEAPDPQSEATFNNCKLQWHLPSTDPYQALYDYYKALIALRKATPALYNLDRSHVSVRTWLPQQILMVHRWHEQQHVVCLMNFSREVQTVEMPVDNEPYEMVFTSSGTEWNRTTLPNYESDKKILQPESITIYNNQNV